MSKKNMKAKIVTSLLIITCCAQGMTPEARVVQADPAQEKLLGQEIAPGEKVVSGESVDTREPVAQEPVVLVEGSTLEWDAVSALVRPEFRTIVEGEYSTQDIATACRTLQAPTHETHGVYQNFMHYIRLNGGTNQRPYGSVERAFEDALVSQLVRMSVQRATLNSGRLVRALDERFDYQHSRFYWWCHQCVGLGVCFPVAAIIMGFCYAYQNKYTCLV